MTGNVAGKQAFDDVRNGSFLICPPSMTNSVGYSYKNQSSTGEDKAIRSNQRSTVNAVGLEEKTLFAGRYEAEYRSNRKAYPPQTY